MLGVPFLLGGLPFSDQDHLFRLDQKQHVDASVFRVICRHLRPWSLSRLFL